MFFVDALVGNPAPKAVGVLFLLVKQKHPHNHDICRVVTMWVCTNSGYIIV